jgi:hypothetical protein
MDHATYELLLDAYRRYDMSKLRREQLFAIIAHHDSKPDPASRAICAAARQALAGPPAGRPQGVREKW